MNEMMGCIDRIIAMMDRGSLESEKTKEEVTKKSEVIVSDEPTLNMIQPVTTKEGKNEIPLIKSDMKTEVMACDGEDAPLASLSDEKTDNTRKKKKARWRFRNWVFVIPGDEAQQQVDVKREKDNMEVYENMVQYHEWCYQLFNTLHVLNKRFELIFTKKKNGKTKLEYTWVEINPELVLTKCLRRHRKVRGICEKLRDSKQYPQALDVSQWMTEHKICSLVPEDYTTDFHLIKNVLVFEEVEKFLEKVPENLRNKSMYTVLILKYAESGKKDIDRTEDVFKKMRELGLLLKPSPFSSMMSLYISVGNRVKVDEILREMKENNVKVDSLTMAKAYLRVGSKREAREMLLGTEELNDPMELMSLYGEAGDREDVYRIRNLYKKTREQDNDGFLTLNFDVCNRAAVMYYNEYEWSSLEFDIRIPTMVVSGFRKRKNFQRADILMNKTLRNIKFGNKSFTLSPEEWGKIERNQVKPSELRDLIKNFQDSTQFPKALEPSSWLCDQEVISLFLEDYANRFDLTEKVLGFKEAQNESDAKENMSLSLGNKIKHLVGGHTLMADRMWEPCGFELYDWKYKKQMESFINQGPNVEEILKVKVLQVSDIYGSYGCKETSVTTSLLNGVFTHETYPLADKLYLHANELEVWHEKIKISNDANICKRLREQVLLRIMSTEKHRKYRRAWKFKFMSKNLIGVCTSRRRYFDPGITKLFREILVYAAVSTMRFEAAAEICLWAHHSSRRLIRRNEPEIKRLHEMRSSMSLKTSSEMAFILHEIGSETVESIIGQNRGSFALELQRNENTPHVWHRWKNRVGKWQAVYVMFNAVLENACSEMGGMMSAMDSSSRNAGKMLDPLTLTYKSARQASITTDLIEIISGASALEAAE
uniref:Pentatricopeptide repeat-containing protein n=1 Tax=Brassica campestris TaxID=3711 RepID=M4E2B2_BRACM